MNENIIPALVCGLGIGLILLVGWLVLHRMTYEFTFVEGYCIDKEGMHNVSQYIKIKTLINCSSNNPLEIDMAI